MPISTQRYKDGGDINKSVMDIKYSVIHQKQGFTTSDVMDIDGAFVVKLRAQDIYGRFFYTQLPLNEDDNNFEEKLGYMNYKKIVKTIHDTGYKNIYFTSADVSMLGYGCGVSQYTHFFVKYLDMYQVLPRPYLGSFGGVTGDKLIKKMVVRLSNSSRNICLGMY